MTRLRPALAPLALFVLAGVLFAPDTLFGDGVYWAHDFRHHHYPWRMWAAERWLAGEVPWWAPGAANGFPLLAEGQGGFLYPPTMVLFMVFRSARALNWAILLHQVWAAMGVWALCRARGLRGAAPVVGGLAWAFGGFLVSHTLYLGMQNAAAWLGWALWAVERRRPAVAGLAIGMMGLAGHPQAAAFGGLLFALYASIRGAWRTLFVGAPAGLLIASPQLVASLQLSQFGMRDGGVGGLFAQIGRLPPQELIGAVLPYAFGLDRPADIAQTYYHRGIGYWGAGENHWEMCFYLGIPVVVAALVGAGRSRTWSVVALLGLLLMLGGPLWDLVRLLPGFSFFRFPARFGLWVSLAVAVLAAHGVHVLTTLPRPWFVRRRVIVVAGLFAVGTFSAFVSLRTQDEAVLAMGRARFERELTLPPPPMEMGALLRAALPAPEPEDASAIPAKVQRIYEDLLRSTSPVSPRVVLPMLLLLATALSLRHPRRFALLVFIDLWVFGHDYHPRSPLSEVRLRPHWLTEEMTQPGGYRTTVLDRRIDPAMDTTMLTASLGLVAGTNDVVIPSPLLLVRNEAMLGRVGLDVGDTGPVKAVRYLEHRDLARRMGVKWIASTHALEGLTRADGGPDFTLWQDDTALPRARVVPCVKVARDGDDAYALVVVEDPEKTVVVERADGVEMPAPGCAAGGTATITRYTDQEVEVQATGPGTLVLADGWYPGWTATVDGRDAPILRADVLFRGVTLDAGAHVVRFRFSPGLPGALLVPALLALLACAALALWTGLRPPASATDRASSART